MVANPIDDYPYIKITKEDALSDFKKLQLRQFKPGDKLNLSVVGNKASNYYFQPYRVKARITKWSHYNAWHDSDQRKKIIAKARKWGKSRMKGDFIPNDLLRDIMRLIYGSINQFKPLVASFVYQKYNPTTVLDFSAGWGDRLIAAIANGINYIGIDSNTSLKTPYQRMIKDYNYKDRATMIFKPSEKVDFSQFKYDMVFTSPPYALLEKYEGMPQYKNSDDFNQTFLIPVVKRTWKYLTPGGIMALNLPEWLYQVLIPYLGEYDDTVVMPLRDRNHKGKHELIYVWFK